MLGIEPRIRITKEFNEKILMLASNNSYDKTSKTIDLLLNEKISSTTVRSKINTIAKSIKQQLKTVNRKNIITDGDSQYKKLVEKVYQTANHKRCLWHIPHILKHLLYLEKLQIKERGVLLSYPSYILKEKDFMKAQYLYINFIYLFKSVNMMSIYNYLYKSYNNIFISEDQWNDSTLLYVTSLAEREMREINRCTDIGCRCSRNGVENLLKIKLAQKYAPQTWEKYFPNMRSNNINTFATICY